MLHINIGKTVAVFFSLIFVSIALPASVVEELITKDIMNKKVKRAQGPLSISEATEGSRPKYFYPTATKRSGSIMKSNQLPLLTEWDQQRFREQAQDLPGSFYSPLEDMDDKALSEYIKGYRYVTHPDKLYESLDNAILKSDMYGEPSAWNQYRYYGFSDRKRKRRNVTAKSAAGKKVSAIRSTRKFTSRLKREADLSPEEVLATLTLWENERQNKQNRREWQMAQDNDYDSDAKDGWLDIPVYPHATEEHSSSPSNYYYDMVPRYYDKRGRWNGFSEHHHKRYLVERKPSEPTRELRFLNPSSHGDYYTINELLAKREPEVALNQRYML